MGGMLQFGLLILLAAATAVAVAAYLRGRRAGPMVGAESGTLYVTGVSPLPNADGEQYVTITGNLSGPSVPGEVVFGRFAWDVNQWPAVGDQLSVLYAPRNPMSFHVDHPGVRPYLGS